MTSRSEMSALPTVPTYISKALRGSGSKRSAAQYTPPPSRMAQATWQAKTIVTTNSSVPWHDPAW